VYFSLKKIINKRKTLEKKKKKKVKRPNGFLVSKNWKQKKSLFRRHSRSTHKAQIYCN